MRRLRSAPQDSARRIHQWVECADAGLTIEEAAQHMGVSITQLYGWRNNLATGRGIHLPPLNGSRLRRKTRKRRQVTPVKSSAQKLVVRCGMSQRELARSMGVSPGAVSHWASGRTRPSHQNLVVLETIAKVWGGNRTVSSSF